MLGNKAVKVLAACAVLFLFSSISAFAADTARIVVQAGHSARVNAIDADAARNLVVTASNDYTVRLWKVTPPGTGTLLRVLSGHTGYVTDVAFNINDEKQIASCSKDMTLMLWSLMTGASKRVDLEQQPSCLAYRPNSNIIAVGSDESNQISFFDANNGNPTDRTITSGAPTTAISYSADGELIAVGTAIGSVEVRDAKTKDILRTIEVSDQQIRFVAFRGHNVVAISRDGIAAYATENGAPLVKQVVEYVLHASMSHNGDTVLIASDRPSIGRLALPTLDFTDEQIDAQILDVVVGTANNNVLVYGETRGQHSWWLQQDQGSSFVGIRTPATIATVVAFGGREHLAVGDNSGAVTIWNLSEGYAPIRFKDLGMRRVEVLVFSKDGKKLYVGGFGKNWLVTINVASMDVISEFGGNRSISMVSPTSAGVAMLDYHNNELILMKEESGEVESLMSNVRLAQASSDQSRLFALSFNEESEDVVDSIHVFEIDRKKFTSHIATHLQLITSFVVWDKPDQCVLVCNTELGDVIEVPCFGGKVAKEHLRHHNGSITASAVVNGKLITGGNDAIVKTTELEWWTDGNGNGSTANKAHQVVFRDHVGQIRSVAAAKDFSMLASCSNDGTVSLYNVRMNPKSPVHFTLVLMDDDWAVFSDDGRFDASESAMRLLKVVKGLDAFPLAGVRDSLFAPNLLSGKIAREQKSAVLTELPELPQIVIHVPRKAFVTDSSEVELELQIVPNNAGKVSVRLHNNDKLIEIRRYTSERNSVVTELVKLKLVKGNNLLRAVVQTGKGMEAEDTVSLWFKQPVPPKPKLYVVAVGINQYKNPSYALSYAKDDATSIVKALQSNLVAGSDFEAVTLFDERATPQELEHALATVERMAKPEDAFVFYYAGHGAIRNGTVTTTPTTGADAAYTFAMHGVTDAANSSMLATEGYSADSLRSHLMRIRALRQTVIIDACYSGLMMKSFSESENVRYVSSIQRATGATILASVLPDKKAKEITKLKHGLFTYAIVKGLEGAAKDSDGDVTVLSLLNYISKEMPSLCASNGVVYQQPVIRFEGAAQSFVLGRRQ